MRIALALRKIGPDALRPLYKALADSDPSVRGWAAFTLGFARIGCMQLKPEGKVAIPALVEALQDVDAKVRYWAVCALGKNRPEPLLTFHALVKSLHSDSSSEVRSAAADALGRLGPLAVPELVEGLEDENSDVRRAAADALGGIGHVAQAAAPALVKLMKDPDRIVREQAAKALLQVDPIMTAKAEVQ
ncbi:MAG: HEAT repeat domain-containing protein [Planctomycetes bacterium]|nr:HEAT repeat domain-containing protein [Planctomycetota bacterium]